MGQIGNTFDALLSNAIRFSPEGGQVQLGIEPAENGQVHTWVKDSGPGIPTDHLETIFQPFFNFNQPATSQPESLGIGLALAKETIRAHGGELWAQNQTGSGASFHFTLRLADK